MNHRGRIVPGDQHRLAWFAFHEVGVVGNDCGDFTVDSFLRAVSVHPRARAFAGARVRIEIPESDVLLRRLVSDFPDANVGMRDGNVRDGREVKIEKLPGYPEDALAQLLELKI